MSRVRGSDTDPRDAVPPRGRSERTVISPLLRGSSGTVGNVFSGSADRRIELFVNGCLWNRHPGCAKTSTPKSNVALWEEKFTRNVQRERRTRAKL